MAGGVNPFGFSMGVLPAPRAPRQPKDLPSAPFGFAPPPSKMQQTLAILNEYNPLPAFERLLKSPMALGGPISEQDIADGLTVAGTVTGGSAAAPKPKNALNMGIRAFHGSPHDFPPVRLIEMPDGQRLYQNMNELAETPQGARIIQEFPLGRFDMSKIGTGEGAQAYGHGLYFAEREGVARSYRDALTPKNYVLNAPEAEISVRHGQDVFDAFVDHGGDRNELQATISRLKSQNNRDLMELGVSDASQINPPNDWGIEANVVRRADRLKRLEGLLSSDDVKVNPGRMYEVEINADPDTFLDWDKPLSEQSEAVRRALPKLVETAPEPNKGPSIRNRQAIVGNDGTVPGDILWNNLGGHNYPDETRKRFLEAGIPGIKYLDAGSRGAGDGTRNYVVFDDKLISIVRKYGIAGASAMLGYNILDGMDPAQADELKRIEGNQ